MIGYFTRSLMSMNFTKLYATVRYVSVYLAIQLYNTIIQLY